MTTSRKPQLLPFPRHLNLLAGKFQLPKNPVLHLPADLPLELALLPLSERLQGPLRNLGVNLELSCGPVDHPRLAICAHLDGSVTDHPDAYTIQIHPKGVDIRFRHLAGLRAAVATLRQLLNQFGRELPCLNIADHSDFPARGIMLDVSRGRVPTLKTLLQLVDHLADFKINQFQLYTEHTFAYGNYEPVWSPWGALTGEEMLHLDLRCRELGIELVPNQNSFGHLRYWLEYPPLKRLAEVSEPYEGTGGTFLRYPTTLAPFNPGTLPFLRGLFDELLPHFTSDKFNVGCDETWDLGRGQTKQRCEASSKGQVYVDFLKEIYREVTDRGRKMMFWGDIVMNHPELLPQLPKDIIALNWGYEANHPFERETGLFAESNLPFYVCPGTSTWMTLLGRHDNAFANLQLAAEAGLKNGAIGYLNTDWGDGGHPQPLAVSYVPYLVGAALSWCRQSYNEKLLAPVLSRDVYHDPTDRTASAAIAMGFSHRKFKYFLPNITPFGTVIAAPIPKTRELMNRDGLKLYARIESRNILAARDDLQAQRAVLYRSKPTSFDGELLAAELDLAARMALQSCDIMLWQQALASGQTLKAARLARRGVRALAELHRDYRAYWPHRNKGTPETSAPWLEWRMRDYRQGKLHFAPEVAAVAKPKTYTAD